MPGTETAGRYHAETTLPARAPVRNRGRERRETPGFQRLDRRTRRHPDWLAEDAVSSEPVSTIEFFESRRLRRKPGGKNLKQPLASNLQKIRCTTGTPQPARLCAYPSQKEFFAGVADSGGFGVAPGVGRRRLASVARFKNRVKIDD